MCNIAARRRAELVVEQRVAEGLGELAKGRDSAHVETAQQYPAALVEVAIDDGLEFVKDIQQAKPRFGRFDQQR
ncbi:hypothetical protein D3C76_1165590 [compost metagenome]